MAYDSETYGQSPFGNPSKSAASTDKIDKTAEKPVSSPSTRDEPEESFGVGVDEQRSDEQRDDLDVGPSGLADFPTLASSSVVSSGSAKRPKSNKAKEKTSSAKRSSARSRRSAKDTAAAEATTLANALNPENIPPTVGRLSEKLGIGRVLSRVSRQIDNGTADSRTERKTKPSAKSNKSRTGTRSSRKSSRSKQKKAAEAVQVEAEAAIARRFQEEDRSAYLSLLYKTGVSALVWAVLRLSRHEFSDDVDRIINAFIHPALIAAIALLGAVGLTFWLRRILNDLARHTQQLSVDAEETGGKNYRPTLEIVGDSLEYNPQLRKELSTLFDITTSLLCSLISYLVVFAAFP